MIFFSELQPIAIFDHRLGPGIPFCDYAFPFDGLSSVDAPCQGLLFLLRGHRLRLPPRGKGRRPMLRWNDMLDVAAGMFPFENVRKTFGENVRGLGIALPIDQVTCVRPSVRDVGLRSFLHT